MCGIAGHVGGPRGADLRARMRAALLQRGPDAQHEAAFAEDGTRLPDDAQAAVGLVHTRLSIIDPRPLADQPMASDDGRVWICYNGEVYGWQADARELEATGVRFRSGCDTEFILRGYEAWGIEALLPRLRGMFAFAIVDFRAGKVHLVRDRLGLKPVVYAHDATGFAFGSTVRSVLPWLPRERRGFSADAIDAYLAHRYIPAPRTVFSGIARLPNAHRLEYDVRERRLAIHRWWSPRGDRQADCAALLDEAIELRLVADRPLGLFLSGGIDSGVIACRLAATGHRELHSFSAAFPGSDFDESTEAAATAEALGLPNERIVVPTSIRDDFTTIVAALDEPFADPSSFPTWYLARATEKRVKVVLGGDGGDELFAGYDTFAAHRVARWYGRLVPRAAERALVAPAVAALPVTTGNMSFDFRARQFLRGARLPTALRTWGWMSAFLPAEMDAVLTPDAGRESLESLFDETLALDREADSPEPIDRQSAVLLGTYLAEGILTKVDRASMAVSLEVRAPFLDHLLVDWVTRLPADMKMRGGAKKWLLRETLRGRLPDAILDRPKKGFGIPLAKWLRGEMHDWAAATIETLGEDLGHLIAIGEARRLLAEHRAGRRDNRKPLWALLCLGVWAAAQRDAGRPVS